MLTTCVSALLLTLSATPEPVAAPPVVGPPAICFALEVPEGSELLPWGEGPIATVPTYDRGRLVADLLGALHGSDDALVHAENLRRAVIYAGGAAGGKRARSARAREALSQALAAALEHALLDELEAVERGERARDERRLALLEFDLGYFLGASRQNGVERDGSADEHLTRAVELAPTDGGLRLAAAMGGFRDLGRDRFEAWFAASVGLPERADGLTAKNALAIGRPFFGVESLEQLKRELGG